MKKIAWITDSTCGLSEHVLNEHNIYVIPLHVIIDGKSYKENIDLTNDEFYEKLKEPNVDAKTSQPAYGKFVRLYEELKDTYDCGIAIHASSSLTGTYQSSVQAAEQTGFSVEVIDSKMGSYALGKMLLDGIKMEQAGQSYESIVKTIRDSTERTEMYLLPASFEQLRKSGRVSTTQAVFASLLNIQLLLKFDDGKVVIADKIRTKRRAKSRFFEIIHQAVNHDKAKEVCLMHSGVLEKAHRWKEELESLHNQVKITIETLVPVAGVHTGYGTMAVSWFRGE
ncbi:MAG TPA: DegV family protein [Bacillota bacterium]|nr:DegV family protein [Bacillota bacterium]